MGIKTFVRMLVILTSGVIMSTSNYRDHTRADPVEGTLYKIAFMTALSLWFIPIFTEEFQDSHGGATVKGNRFQKDPLW